MAAWYGIGKDTVARIWQARRIRPWKVETFNLSTDASSESKLRDVVGLYVNPPAKWPSRGFGVQVINAGRSAG